MSMVYALVLILCSVYFFIRRFDIISLAFFGIAVYSMPLAFGNYADTTTAIYIIAMILMLLISVIRINEINYTVLEEFLRKRANVIHMGALISFAYVILVDGILVKTSKLDIDPTAAGISSALNAMFLQLSLLHLYFLRSRAWAAFIVLNYISIVLSGDRTQIVLSALMLLTLHLWVARYSLFSFIRNNKAGSAMAAIALLIFGVFGKAIYGLYFQYNVTQSVDMNEVASYIEQSYGKLESVHVMLLMDWVVVDGFQIQSDYLFHTFAQFLPFSFGNEINSHYIPNYFKSMYFTFSHENYGTSANFYAEGYLNSGFFGALMFIFLHIFILLLISRSMRSRNGAMLMIALLSAPVVGFYIHRLSLFQLIAFEKRILYVVIFLTLVSLLPKVRIRFGRN